MKALKILFLAHRIPYPPNKGDKIRSYHELVHLSRRHEVSLACFVDRAEEMAHVETLKGLCASVDAVPLDPRWARAKSAAGLLGRRPLSLAYFSSAEMRRRVEARLAETAFDAIFVFSSVMGAFVPKRVGTPMVVDFVDVDSDKWRQYARFQPLRKKWIYKIEAGRLARFERAAGRRAAACVFATESDAALFRQMAPDARVFAVENGVDTGYFTPDDLSKNPSPLRGGESGARGTAADGDVSNNIPSPLRGEGRVRGRDEGGADAKRIVFTGAMDYFPNVDAVCHFAREIWPTIRREVPGAAFTIVGSHPAEAVRRLAAVPGITVTGSVPDVRAFLSRASVSVAPVRIARGVQNKVLEAMAMGLPVVASREAFEGIRATPGEDLFVENNPQRFATRVIRILRNPHLAVRLAENARRVIQERYDWDRNMSILERLVERAALRAPVEEAEGLSSQPAPQSAQGLQAVAER